MFEIAKSELNKNNYVVANAVIKTFTEIIDAYLSKANNLIDEASLEGWKERIHWMSENNHELLNEWKMVNSLCFEMMNQGKYYNNVAIKLIEIVQNRLNKIGSDDYGDYF
ncbi:MAG TPA: hypothetical protein VJ767_09500 [Nitrososphaeraceae archaeon]|nr:hypothetical protein [Nitrososphaeraceae archaeon]